MADANVPATVDGPAVPAIPTPEPNAATGGWQSTLPAPLAAFVQQPAFNRALPALIGIGALAALAAVYMMIASGPQRILYSSLSDGERAKVVDTLERGGIGYTIDNGTGALSVAEDDVYRARMLVASDAGLAAPQGASEMLDAIPLGSSRTLEGERLRLARERELMLTIREIDGIESVRVHLATPERSVFVRNAQPPSASVMVRLVGGRSLSQDQVEAIVNLVSASVPGMTSDAVRVVDQNGRLLSAERDAAMDGLMLQREFETKLRDQIASLLTPLLGEGNFSSQVQVKLDSTEVTSATEKYDEPGVVRSESERKSSRMAGNGVGGVPGVTANTPPPDAELVDEAPNPEAAGEGEETDPAPTDTESSTSRNYEVGREVAVTNTRPGGLMKLSVAVAVSDEALTAAAPMTAEQLQSLVSAAVGADPERGDTVEVIPSAFETTEMEPLAFYEQPWFAMVVRYATALIAVLLVLFLAVRPMIGSVKGEKKDKKAKKGKKGKKGEDASEAEDEDVPVLIDGDQKAGAALPNAAGDMPNRFADLPKQVELARQLAAQQPERAVEALQRMLEAPPADEKATAQ
ncbi:MAG: flagellar basal-body MS-ring/collar protein FliF [Pseudomonadota bacterium]